MAVLALKSIAFKGRRGFSNTSKNHLMLTWQSDCYILHLRSSYNLPQFILASLLKQIDKKQWLNAILTDIKSLFKSKLKRNIVIDKT